MRSAPWLLMALLVFSTSLAAEEKIDRRFLELTVGEEKFQGRQYVSDRNSCWLLQQDGHLKNIELAEVQAFRQISSTFKPYSMNELRTQLLKEFGRAFEVETRGQHLVVAPLGKARMAAEILDKTSKSFVSYFTRRSLKLDKIELPLITLVFSTQHEFLAYCKLDKVKRTSGLRGYYSPTTNRVALYMEQPGATTAARSIHGDIRALSIEACREPELAPFRRESVFGAPQGANTFIDTLAHETTHQLGFNTGLHSRLGDDPVWVIEGLAMLFEGDANRDDEKAKTTVSQRINRERFVWFQDYLKSRRKPKSLEDFLTSDGMFESATLDAYSEAWALMFFLAETRPSQLSSYVKKLAYRTELGEYSALRRLDDFKEVFGKDVKHLEVQYLRFISDLELPKAASPVTTGSKLEQEFEQGKAKLPPVTIR